jgi:hypothetical protein
VIGILWHTPSPNNLNNLKAQEKKKKRKMSGRLVVWGLVGNERRGELKGLGVKGMNEFFTLLFGFFFSFSFDDLFIFLSGRVDAIAATAVGESQKRDGSDPALEELVGTRSSKCGADAMAI